MTVNKLGYILYFAFLFQSCCWSTKNTSLGNGYKVSEYNIKDVGIMHCGDPCCNSGTWVIPETFVAYNFDSKWIIAKTDSTYYNNSEDFAYWIFNKDFSIPAKDLTDSISTHLIGPVDSVTFYKLISEKGIRLQLKDYLK